MQTVITNSVDETEAFAAGMAKKLSTPVVVAFFGGLGMGKTAFTRGLAKGLGLNCEVTSPTFALVHEYCGKTTLYHFDMYRINGFDDLYSTGFFDYLDSGAVLAVEWSENIENILPENTLKIEFLRGENDGERILRMSGDSREQEKTSGLKPRR